MKKAKLDILDDMLGIEYEMPAVQATALPADETEVVPVESGKRWAFNKLLMIGAPVLLVVLILGGALLYFLTRTVTSVATKTTVGKGVKQELAHQADGRKLQATAGGDKQAGTKPVVLSGTPEFIYVKDFMIDLKDAHGNSHVLMCDVAFDVAPEQKNEQLENNTAVRNVIYKTARSRSAVALKSAEERKKIKIELAMELEKILGKGSVKNVYFTNYFIM